MIFLHQHIVMTKTVIWEWNWCHCKHPTVSKSLEIRRILDKPSLSFYNMKEVKRKCSLTLCHKFQLLINLLLWFSLKAASICTQMNARVTGKHRIYANSVTIQIPLKNEYSRFGSGSSPLCSLEIRSLEGEEEK